MTIENIVLTLTFVASTVALYFSIRKQKHDVNNVDADTIASLFQTVRELGKENKEIRAEFAEYKRVTSAQIGELSSEIVRYRKWAKRLVGQIEGAGLTPTRFEDC